MRSRIRAMWVIVIPVLAFIILFFPSDKGLDTAVQASEWEIVVCPEFADADAGSTCRKRTVTATGQEAFLAKSEWTLYVGDVIKFKVTEPIRVTYATNVFFRGKPLILRANYEPIVLPAGEYVIHKRHPSIQRYAAVRFETVSGNSLTVEIEELQRLE